MMNNLWFIFDVSGFSFDFDELSILDEVLDNSEECCCDKVDTYSTWCSVDEWAHHESHEDVHKAHHFAHVRHGFTARSYCGRGRFCLVEWNEFWLDVDEDRTYNSKNDVFTDEKVDAEKSVIDSISIEVLCCERRDEWVDIVRIEHSSFSSCEGTDNVEKAEKDGDLYEKRHTSFEWSKSVGFHHLHSFLRKFCRVVRIFVLDLFEFFLHVTHPLLHLSLVGAYFSE